jgi:hypothetical protein
MAIHEIRLREYQSKLLTRVEVAEGTMAFHFEKLPGFVFKPGQCSDLTLQDPPGTTPKKTFGPFPLPVPHLKRSFG